MLLDLSGLEFVDVVGARSILAASRRSEQAGQRLVVAAIRRQARTVFALTGIDAQLRFADAS